MDRLLHIHSSHVCLKYSTNYNKTKHRASFEQTCPLKSKLKAQRAQSDWTHSLVNKLQKCFLQDCWNIVFLIWFDRYLLTAYKHRYYWYTDLFIYSSACKVIDYFHAVWPLHVLMRPTEKVRAPVLPAKT